MTVAHLIALVPLLATIAAGGGYVPDLPKESVPYTPAKYTQSLSQLREAGSPFFARKTLPVRITDLPNTDWHQSGGKHGIKGVFSVKYKTASAVSKYAPISVLNQFGHYQSEYGIVRMYPDGARFDDVLWYKGKVFEHRTRIKADGEWSSSTVFKDETARPPGYAGLKVTCASCHNQAGQGKYGAGLVPGYDGVFSDELDWSVVPNLVIAP